MVRTGLSHIALKSRDLKKTEKFYVDVLGCKVAFPSSAGHDFLDDSRQRGSIEFREKLRAAFQKSSLAAHRI